MTPKEKKWAPLAAQEAWQLPKWRISSDAKQTKSRVTVLHGARHRIMQPKPKCRNQRRKNHTLNHNVKRESELKPQALLRRCVAASCIARVLCHLRLVVSETIFRGALKLAACV